MFPEVNTIYYKLDTFEILPEIPDNSVDLVLTDPPYDLDEIEKEYLHNEFLRISRGAVIVFSPPENQWILPADQYCFWVKPISTKNTSKNYSRFVEMIFIYGRGAWNTDRHWSQYTNVFPDLVDSTKDHPQRKPPSLIERLVLNHTEPGDLILDPFGGSFVVADVAERTGRNFISWDISSYQNLDERTTRKVNKLCVFPYYGGKNAHLKFILPLLPKSNVYVEPFGGSAAVLLNKEPSSVEVYNDLDKRLCTFFRVLRDRPNELMRHLRLTPYSRYELAIAREHNNELSDLEVARRVFTEMRQRRGTATGWGYAKSTRGTSRGMPQRISALKTALDNMEQIAERLLTVQIENSPAVDVIERFDSPDTLFYCDPPYLPDSRVVPEAYAIEMSMEDHMELAELLNNVKGKVAISLYENETSKSLYPGWFKRSKVTRSTCSDSNNAKRVEVLYTNYDPSELER